MSKRLSITLSGALLAAGLLSGYGHQDKFPDTAETTAAPHSAASRDDHVSATFSIIAVEPQTGICGAAVASKYPAVGEVVPYVEGGVGAFVTQHRHKPDFGPKVLALLDEGDAGMLQLAVVDRHGRTAQHNPFDAPEGSRWWGAMSGRFYASQGNTLVGGQVIAAMAAAYENTTGSLADRLMAALVAGDCAGGDSRGRLAASIVVDRPDFKGSWLNLQVDKSDDAVLELAKKYVEIEHEAKGEWSKGPWQHSCP